MANLRLDIDQETYVRLVEQAVAERRPIQWQAEVVIRRALGLPFPPEATDLTTTGPCAAAAPAAP